MSRVNLKISISGVRGVVGDSLTPALIADFAAAFGEYVGGGRVIVGRDTRPSGAMFEYAVNAGLLSVGCQPVQLGVVPTPTMQIMVDEYNANGGIAITASHNAAEWNAIKFISASGIFLNETEARELLDVYNQPDRAYAREPDYRQTRVVPDGFAAHQRRIFKQMDRSAVQAARFRVAVDCVNGVGGLYSADFLREMGCEVYALNDEPDGLFRRDPEPHPENLAEIARMVTDRECHIGFAQDPDGDRLAIIDETGRPLGEQASVMLAVEHMLSIKPGPVVVNIQTTRGVEEIAARYGCETFAVPVGEIYVTARMLKERAVIGGEGSCGGIIYPEVYPCRDSFTGMALMLDMLARRGEPLSAIMDRLPRYDNTVRKIHCTTSSSVDIIRRLRSVYAQFQVDTPGGLKLSWDDRWVLIRASNTEPIMRVFAEAGTKENAEALANQIIEEIQSMIGPG